jgi:hypothetical protein
MAAVIEVIAVKPKKQVGFGDSLLQSIFFGIAF